MEFDYLKFTVEDFVLDQSFRKWVKNPDNENDGFWKSWISKHPEKAETINQARKIIMLLDIKENEPAEGKFLEIWERVIINNKEEDKVVPIDNHNQLKSFSRISFLSKIAAAIVVLVLLSAVVYKIYDYNSFIEHTTAYGQTKEITLPDGSKVTLNGNSLIKYAKKWDKDEYRVVKLDGEAYFSVTHQENDQKFLVETSDLNVEVLGTEFNVLNRKSRAVVVLSSGKVRLDIKENLNKVIDQGIIMQPGDLIEYSLETSTLEKRNVNPEVYSSWKNDILIFQSTSLAEIAQMLEESHGLNVKIEGKRLAEETFTGSFPTGENTEILLNMLAKSFNFKIIYAGDNTVIFKHQN